MQLTAREQAKLAKLEESHKRTQASMKKANAKVDDQRKLAQVVTEKLKKGEEVRSPLSMSS